MRFLFVMDPLDRVLVDKDTTFAFMRAAQKRGHQCLFSELRDLYIESADVWAIARDVTVNDAAPHFHVGEPKSVRIADVSAVLIRKDPPFDSAYLFTTLLLERARGRTVIMNDPRGLRDANEKLYALHFARHMPRTFVGADREKILEFVDSVGGVGVIKPLFLAGGAGVMQVSRRDKNARSIIETLTNDGKSLAMVQEYLPDVVLGDKRVLLIDGELIGAINRVPREDDLRSNIHVGGRVEPCELTDKERAIVRDISPKLREDGLYFVGLDMIGGKLTEVNVTSPTGIQELSRHTGKDMADPVIAWIERRAEDFRPQLKSIPDGL